MPIVYSIYVFDVCVFVSVALGKYAMQLCFAKQYIVRICYKSTQQKFTGPQYNKKIQKQVTGLLLFRYSRKTPNYRASF